jgi:trimethylamine--corrinoid protein Co-methyltransferase
MTSNTPDLKPIILGHQLEILSPGDLEFIQGSTLRLLEEVGVHFPSQSALAIFSDHGAKVDADTQIVRIPASLVEKAMSTAPRSFVLAGREERFDLLLDGTRSYLSTDGCGVHVVDLETREHRPSRTSDVALMARVCDALPLIGFYWPLVSAQEHGLTAPLHECHAGLTNTLKHVRGGTTVFPQLARYIVEMAVVVSGTEEGLRRRPPICANICTIAPLAQDGDGIETALIYAEAGIPTSFMAMPTMGSTAPATPLGALVVGDAEVISAMVLIQLAYPGAPVFYSNFISLMDPRTGGYIGEVPVPFSIITVQLAHAWNVPSLGGGSVSSDAAVIGWQSGSEAGLGAAKITLAGGEICGFMGMVGSSMILYPEQIILDYEVCQNGIESLDSFEVDEIDLAFDVIKDVGPGGHYLRQKHTARHLRDFRYSPILRGKDDKNNPLDPRELALKEFKKISETHHPKPLPDDVLKELEIILATADKAAEGLH